MGTSKRTSTYMYILTALMLALFLVSLLPFFYAAFFCHPTYDDFNFSTDVHRALQAGGGLFSVLKSACSTAAKNYIGWQGTFSAIFLFALQPGVFSQDLYFLTTFVMIFSLSLATFFLIDTVLVFCFKAERAYSILISSAVLFCTLQFLVNMPEALFWWNGSVYYTFFHALALCFFALVIRMYVHGKGGRHSLCFGVALFLAFVIGGGNYSTALFTACLMCLALLFLTKAHAVKLWQYYLIFFVFVISFFISVVAPGNSVRATDYATYYDGYNPIEAIVSSINYAFHYIGHWTKLPQIVLFTFVSPFLYSVARKIKFGYKYPLLVLVLSFLCFATLLTPPLYAMGSVGSDRQVNIYYYTYYLFMLFNIFYFSGWAAKRNILNIDIETLFKAKYALPSCVILVLFFISSCEIGFYSLNSGTVWRAISSGEVWQYEWEYMETINRVQNGEEIIADVSTCPAGVFYKIGLKNGWVADTVAAYYDVEPFSVVTTDTAEDSAEIISGIK